MRLSGYFLIITVVLMALLFVSYQNLPATDVLADPGSDAASADSLSQVDPGFLEEEIDTYLEAHRGTGRFMGSDLVVQGDEVLFSGGYGMANLEHNVRNLPQTNFRIGSTTKQFTAAAVLQTLRQTTTLNELLAWFKDEPLEFAPGERYSYSNSGYVLLTQIVERVSGQTYTDYLWEHIFKPLDMGDSGYDSHESVITIGVAIISLKGVAPLVGRFVPAVVYYLTEILLALVRANVAGEAMPPERSITVIAIVLYSEVFVALAIWRFRCEEF